MPDLDRPAIRVLRTIAGVAAVLVGLALIAAAAFVGDCSFAGGRCPADPDPLTDSDTFKFAALGTFIGVSVPIWLARPTLRRLGLAVAIGVVAAIVIGLAVRSSAAG